MSLEIPKTVVAQINITVFSDNSAPIQVMGIDRRQAMVLLAKCISTLDQAQEREDNNGHRKIYIPR